MIDETPRNDLGKGAQAIPQLADTPIPEKLKLEMQQRMASYPDHRSAALPCLAAAQRAHGWLTPEAFRQVAAVMQVTPAYLASVATFYDMFETKERGRHTIYMCTNISCMLRGADQVLEALEAETGVSEGGTTNDGEIYLRRFECLGACDMAPMASVDGTFVGPLTVADAKDLVADLRAGREVLPAKALKQNTPTAAARRETGSTGSGATAQGSD